MILDSNINGVRYSLKKSEFLDGVDNYLVYNADYAENNSFSGVNGDSKNKVIPRINFPNELKKIW
jgi:hypothetical protein